MKIIGVRGFPVKLPRDLGGATGTAGSPARLTGPEDRGSEYRWAENYRTVYSTHIETTLVRVDTDEGLSGWGESQSPVAPEITASVINSLLGPLIIGEDALAPEALWDRMYAAMRVRGHTGSFLLDAIAGIDIAVWDLCGKAYDQPVYRLLGGPLRQDLPCYVSGLAGSGVDEKLALAERCIAGGARAFKLFMHGSQRTLLAEVDALRDAFGAEIEIFVDALWRLSVKSALLLARELARRDVGWLEAPLMPEDLAGHRRLARGSPIPIALGESYRTRFELLPFLQSGAVHVLQPDIGRSGITEGRKLANLAEAFHVAIAPHVSIGLGPQIAAVLHLGAASSNLRIIECNPQVYEIANSYLQEPIGYDPGSLSIPTGPGLGIQIDEEGLGEFLRKPQGGYS
jgi:D-galactarolactone cycloisomerase